MLKYKTKFKIIIFLIVISISIFSGCYPTGEREELSRNILGNTVELKRELMPNYYYDTYDEKINDYISIVCNENNLYIPDEINFSKVIAKKKVCTEPEKIKGIFLDGNVETKTTQIDNNTYYYYTSENGSKVSITDDNITYVAENTPYAYDYGYLFRGDNTTCNPKLNMFYKNTEIEGIDKNYAINLVCDKLDAIGVDYYSKPKVICLDTEGVATTLEYLDKIYGVIKPLDGRADIHDFSKDDEAYLIIFNHSFGDMPISYEMHYNNEFSFEACYTYAVVGKNGLVYFESSFGYIPTESEKIDKLFNIDVILKALNAKYGGCEMKRDYILNEIHLEYVCENERPEMTEGIIFEPYYVCYFITNKEKNSGADMGDRLYSVVFRINAVTGEFLETADSNDLV